MEGASPCAPCVHLSRVLCAGIAAGSQHPAALLPVRAPVTLPRPELFFADERVPVLHPERAKKFGQCRDQVIKLQGPGEAALV